MAYQGAIDRGAKWAAVHNNLGLALGESGRYESAIEHLERAIKLDPGFAFAHMNLGMFFGQMGRDEEAIESYQCAITLDPGYVTPHNDIGVIFYKLGRYESAIESYQRAITLDPGFAHAHVNLAWLLATAKNVALRDPLEAVRLARRATELEPTDSYCWGAQGVALFRAGETEEAVEQLEKAIRLREEQDGGPSIEYAFFLSMALCERGALEEARSWYDRGVERIEAETAPDPNRARFRSEAAELLGIQETDDE